MQFADQCSLLIKAGNGGNGIVAWRREAHYPEGGPYGGEGGKGGDVIFTVKRNLRTLANLRHKHCFKARNGGDGQGWNRYGADGEDCVIAVPPGTTIRDAETDEILFDFTNESENHQYVFLIVLMLVLCNYFPYSAAFANNSSSACFTLAT